MNKDTRWKTSRIPWTKEELEILSSPETSETLAQKLPGRTPWVIRYKRRQLGISLFKAGRPHYTPDEFPDVDWSQTNHSIERKHWLSRRTVTKLKRMVLARTAEAATLPPPT